MALRDVTNRVFGKGNIDKSGTGQAQQQQQKLVDDGRGVLRAFSHTLNPTTTSMSITFDEIRLNDRKEFSSLVGQPLNLIVSIAGTSESKVCQTTHTLKNKEKLSFFFKDPTKSSTVFSIRRRREEIFTELTITSASQENISSSKVVVTSSIPYMAKDENNYFFYPLHASYQSSKGKFMCGEIKLKVEYRTEDFFEDSASEDEDQEPATPSPVPVAPAKPKSILKNAPICPPSVFPQSASELTPVSESSEGEASPYQSTTPFHTSVSSSAFTPFVDGSSNTIDEGDLTPISVDNEDESEKSKVRFLIKNKEITPSKVSKSPMIKRRQVTQKINTGFSAFETRGLKAFLLLCIPIIFAYYSMNFNLESGEATFGGQLVQSGGNLAAAPIVQSLSTSPKRQSSFQSPSSSVTSLHYPMAAVSRETSSMPPATIIPKINVQNVDQGTFIAAKEDVDADQMRNEMHFEQQQHHLHSVIPSRNQLNQELMTSAATTVAASVHKSKEGPIVKTLLVSEPVKVQIVDAEDGACFRWKRGLFGGHGSWRKECNDDSWWIVRPAGEKGLQMQHFRNGKCLCPKRCHEENVNFVLRSCDRCACGNGWQLDQTTQILTWETTVMMERKQYWASPEEKRHEEPVYHHLSACLARNKNKASSKMCYHDDVRKVSAKTQVTSVLPSGRPINSLAVYDGISSEKKSMKIN